MNHFLTIFPEIAWPAIPRSQSAALMSILFQLEISQGRSPEELALQQFRQLGHVIQHAYQTVPFYRRRFDEAKLDPVKIASPDRWSEVPLLTRRDIQTCGAQLHSTAIPPTHGPVKSTATGGSTNQPVVTLGTGMTELFWQALTLRDHFWHCRDFAGSIAAIRYTGDSRARPPLGQQSDNWGVATANMMTTGPAYLLNIQSSVEEQAAWLLDCNPTYVLSYPSVLLALSQIFADRDWTLPRLREIRTFGEILEPGCRASCQRVFGAKVVDMYSSQEVGYIALQCPQQEHYHVQSENLLVEILDESGVPCQPGEIGRVVITTLHNFAMPLLRYDIGDYAEVGEQCSCGRGLPVLKRILGRQRNLLVMPDGQRRWPIFNEGERPEELPLFYQFQAIQRSREHLEIRVVRDGPLSRAEEEAVVRYLQQSLGHPFMITIICVDSIPRSPAGKFEDFISFVE